ncbi:hypothetical protein Sste5346_008511 [Sporothrix stenoceras]|uniref:Zn(2)-C6 fungal-type domain-containing protein n=1 Tax=Sporothrix stenoceras TaxID=5173 RepID=A0ABR3YRT9_9PEZI
MSTHHNGNHPSKRARVSWPDREASSDGQHTGTGADRHQRPKARKACVNCRSQKMRCVPSDDDPHTCRRCQRTDVPCVFVPRANAATFKLPNSIAALAATATEGPGPGPGPVDTRFKSDVLRRLHVLEEYLGLAASSGPPGAASGTTAGTDTETNVQGHEVTVVNVDEDDNDSSSDSSSDDDNDDLPPSYASLGALWQAVSVLQASVPVPGPTPVPHRIWKKRTVGELWLAFHERMPGLHFMPRKQIFSVPQPLLLASILYCSSVRGPRDAAAELAPHYFAVLCNAIAQLSIPDSPVGRPSGGTADDTNDPADPDASAYEEWAFQTVLGIVLAGLLTEASNRVVGLWISVAYRLILEHCPSEQSFVLPSVVTDINGNGVDSDGAGAGREWRKLFSGVQIIDLEHASLHLSCPVIPLESPLPALNVGYRDQLYRLSRMMHTGLTHFTGRGLPTIWSVFTTSNSAKKNRVPIAPFSAIDAAVIRDWARQLDDWLVEFSRSTPVVGQLALSSTSSTTTTSADTRKLVFRQYVLHRLVVLSIYHPARGCDLWSNSITPQEQHELLLSARATLKLHLHDDSIWANWDLVMITWAALIVIQGIEGGVGEADDLQNIQVHLTMLKQMNDHKLPLYRRLISRLEESLQGVHTPDVPMQPDVQYDQQQQQQQQQQDQQQQQLRAQPSFLDRTSASAGIDYQSWHIFDQASLQQIGYPVDWSILRS